APGAPAGERLPGEATIVDDTRLLVAFNQRVDPMGDLGLRRKVRSLALASQARSAAPKQHLPELVRCRIEAVQVGQRDRFDERRVDTRCTAGGSFGTTTGRLAHATSSHLTTVG